MTIFHEFMHALYRGWHGRKIRDLEPFFRNDRISELGLASEQAIFDGIICSAGRNPESVASPYGLKMYRFPGGLSGYGGNHAVRASAASRGITATALTTISWAEGHTSWNFIITNTSGVSTDFLPHEEHVVTSVDPQPRATTVRALAARGFKRKYRDDTSSEDEDEGGAGTTTEAGSTGQAGAQGTPGDAGQGGP
ncbi:hypothetical protein BDV97DRAFT_373221 [Delphinella strobiligena]|nr:hypothetical protein BDV97DRAFT_373221 [Delphinella strobiligena]